METALTREQFNELLAYVPHWHACVYGPVPFGQNDPIQISVDRIVLPTREEAEESVWDHVRSACEMWRHEFDEEDWEIAHLVCENGN